MFSCHASFVDPFSFSFTNMFANDTEILVCETFKNGRFPAIIWTAYDIDLSEVKESCRLQTFVSFETNVSEAVHIK